MEHRWLHNSSPVTLPSLTNWAKRTRKCEEPAQRLNVEFDQDNVSVLNDITIAFGANLAAIA